MTETLTPLGKAIATDLRQIKTPGLLLPVRKHDETMLVLAWDGAMHAMMLTGPRAFTFFSVSLQSPHIGLFIPEPELLIDMSSAKSAIGREEDQGLLVLSDKLISVIGKQAGNDFAYPVLVPLWAEVAGGSEAAKVALTRWGIGIMDGARREVLWEFEHKNPDKA